MKIDLFDRLIAQGHSDTEVLPELLAERFDVLLCRLTAGDGRANARLDNGGLPNRQLDATHEAEHVGLRSPPPIRRLDAEVGLRRQLCQANVLLGSGDLRL